MLSMSMVGRETQVIRSHCGRTTRCAQAGMARAYISIMDEHQSLAVDISHSKSKTIKCLSALAHRECSSHRVVIGEAAGVGNLRAMSFKREGNKIMVWVLPRSRDQGYKCSDGTRPPSRGMERGFPSCLAETSGTSDFPCLRFMISHECNALDI